MNYLVLDCSAGMKVYLNKNGELFCKIDDNVKKHTDELLVCVDKLLFDANLKISDLDVIAVCVGPGSFTGIRVAVSICKGLAVESNVKVMAVTNFDILQCGVNEDAIFLLDAFSNYVYVRKNINGCVQDYCVDFDIFIEEYNKLYSNISLYVIDEKVQNRLKNNEISYNIAENNTILCVDNKIAKNEYIDLNKIEPVYLRASQAEIERNKKLGK